jgi:hypothetical protein
MPKFETTLTHVGDTTTITTDDPEVHATVASIDSARLIDDAGDRKRFELPRQDAHIHFPHLLDNS